MTKQSVDYQDELSHMSEETALDQSIALNRIVTTLLEQSKKQTRLTAVLLLVSIVVNLLIVGAFLWYESGDGNNIYQAGDSARYIQGDLIEEATDGTTDSNGHYSHKNQNP